MTKMPGIAALGLVLAVASAWGQANYAGPIIDVHAHVRLSERLGGLSPSHPPGIEALRALDDAAGVGRSALVVIAMRGRMEQTRADNDAVIDLAASSAKRFYPVVSVPGRRQGGAGRAGTCGEAGRQADQAASQHARLRRSDPAVAAVLQKCGALGLVVLMDAFKPWDPGQMGKLVLLSLKHPKTRFVLAHMGFSQFREAAVFADVRKVGMGSNNVWFDLSVIATAYAGSPIAPELVWTMRRIGIDRMQFGSDWPVDSPAAAVAAIRRLGLDEQEQRKVFHDNAAALLGLD
jgi:predicted TIM-barrel fold metal-dependent hydrolase